MLYRVDMYRGSSVVGYYIIFILKQPDFVKPNRTLPFKITLRNSEYQYDSDRHGLTMILASIISSSSLNKVRKT